jgi:cell division protein FtsB
MGEQKQDRWRRPGMRLAILALVIVAFYFLAIFVRQSWNLYQLSKEVRTQEEQVARLQQENERLRQILTEYTGENGKEILAKESLLYRYPDEGVVMPVEVSGGTAPPEQPAGAPPQEVAAVPAWQRWWQVIFTPLP